MPIRLFCKKPQRSAAPAPGGAATEDYRPAERMALSDDPLLRLMQLERYGVMLSQPGRWHAHAKFKEVQHTAVKAVDDRFGLVPEGYVSIAGTLGGEPGAAEQDVEIGPFLLARHAVTQAEFQMFVDGGGYQDVELWPEDIWPHLIDLVDLTGRPGPRFWREGRHDHRLANHPVVGVCFYEAAAYARWVGFRLASEAEWQMAASWRIRSAADTGRRYPWGDALELENCNVWACGHARTLPVQACPAGAAPNGVLQLIGNVWEWTDSDFCTVDDEGQTVVGDTLMKSIRGGAFDTYFAWQATSSFRTGLACLARTHNVGFRCALDLSTPEDAGALDY